MVLNDVRVRSIVVCWILSFLGQLPHMFSVVFAALGRLINLACVFCMFCFKTKTSCSLKVSCHGVVK